MVKADWRPWKEMLGEMIPIALFLAVGNWVLRGFPLWAVLLVGCGSFTFLGVTKGKKEFKRLQGAEQRRQAAASSTQWFALASPQPYPAPEALPLPFVISKRPGWLGYLLTPILVWVGVVICLYGWFWPYIWPHYGPLIHTLAFSLALTLAISAWTLLSMYHWIEADEDGLTVRTLFRSKSILWHEARLFAVDAALKAKKTPDCYELSSAKTILRWPWKRKHSRFTRLSCPFAEFDLLPISLAVMGFHVSRRGVPATPESRPVEEEPHSGLTVSPQASAFPQALR